MAAEYHIAQYNIARMIAPLHDPQLAGFVVRLHEINALADMAPGFVWRLQTDSGNSTEVRAYDDERMLVNLSVWETPEDWHAFVFRGSHVEVMRQRSEWFERAKGPYSAMWWVPAGQVPSVFEARERLEYLQVNGESSYAFSFAKRFPPPGLSATT